MSHRQTRELAAEPPPAALETARIIAERHRVSIRTVERWCDAGILPPPLMRVNGRKFWASGTTAKPDATTR
jgi:hypothetical protein